MDFGIILGVIIEEFGVGEPKENLWKTKGATKEKQRRAQRETKGSSMENQRAHQKESNGKPKGSQRKPNGKPNENRRKINGKPKENQRNTQWWFSPSSLSHASLSLSFLLSAFWLSHPLAPSSSGSLSLSFSFSSSSVSTLWAWWRLRAARPNTTSHGHRYLTDAWKFSCSLPSLLCSLYRFSSCGRLGLRWGVSLRASRSFVETGSNS